MTEIGKSLLGAARRAARIARDIRGGVAIWFGLMFPVLTFAVLVAVEFARASSADEALQDAVDAAALIAARSTAITSEELDAIGDAALIGALQGVKGINGFTADADGRLSMATFSVDGSTVTATATGTSEVLVAGTFIPAIEIHAGAEVVRSINKLEIAMVLDTTGSMSGTKLSNLQTAAKNFITTMEAAAARSTETNPVRISIVPFSTSVRVNDTLSMSSYNTSTHSMTGLPTWLDGRAQSTAWNKDIFDIANATAARIDRFEMLKNMGLSWGGCIEARMPPYDIRETAPSSSNVDTLFTPYFAPDEPDTSSAYGNDYMDDETSGNWSVRQGNYAKYAVHDFNYWSYYLNNWTWGPNQNCNPATIQRLSTNFSALRSHIDTFVASGETNIPLGLMWGWHTLSPNAPLADGVAYSTPNTTKIIVLMTDGDNTMGSTSSSNSNGTRYHGYGYGWQNRVSGLSSSSSSTRTSKLNGRMVGNGSQEDLCGNIRGQNIIIYTVGVGVSSSSQTLLTDCAGTAEQYYDVSADAGDLDTAFDAIAGSIQNLRLSR